MLQRLLNILSSSQEEEDPESQLDLLLDDIKEGIDALSVQYSNILEQEKRSLKKVDVLIEAREKKIELAKQALVNDRKMEAESFYRESELVDRQVIQYKRIAQEVRSTKEKLETQRAQLQITQDKLLSKRTIGEASLNASQKQAELAERMMILNESDELSKFDDLIKEAECKSEAIAQINENEAVFEMEPLDESSNLNRLEHQMKEEEALKMEKLLEEQRNLINRVFGEEENTNTALKDKQREMVNRLKSDVDTKERDHEDKLSCFFDQGPENAQANEARTHVKDFFENQEEDDRSDDQKSIIHQFFKNK